MQVCQPQLNQQAVEPCAVPWHFKETRSSQEASVALLTQLEADLRAFGSKLRAVVAFSPAELDLAGPALPDLLL